MEARQQLAEEVGSLNSHLLNNIGKFVAGSTSKNYDKWATLTSDKEILSTISGLEIDNDGLDLDQVPSSFPNSVEKDLIIDSEIQKLIQKQVISTCERGENDFFSPIFVTEKPDGSHRMILNLKRLNENSSKIHFKMDTIHSITSLIIKGVSSRLL